MRLHDDDGDQDHPVATPTRSAGPAQIPGAEIILHGVADHVDAGRRRESHFIRRYRRVARHALENDGRASGRACRPRSSWPARPLRSRAAPCGNRAVASLRLDQRPLEAIAAARGRDVEVACARLPRPRAASRALPKAPHPRASPSPARGRDRRTRDCGHPHQQLSPAAASPCGFTSQRNLPGRCTMSLPFERSTARPRAVDERLA